jgi:signal peptidase I
MTQDSAPIEPTSQPQPAPDPADERREIGKAILREIVETVALFAVVFTVARLTIGNYAIIGSSMEPNYYQDQRLLVDKVAPRVNWLDRGDIVIVRDPRSDKELIKRLIGKPGDLVELRDNRVVVNGKTLEEPYLPPGADSGPRGNGVTSWQLQENEYMVMGDNRSASDDSRTIGPIKEAGLIGRALVVYWPFENFQIVRHHDYP